MSYIFVVVSFLALFDSETDVETFTSLIIVLGFLITNIVFLHKSKSFIKSKVDELEERLKTIENQKKGRNNNRNSQQFKGLTDEEKEEVDSISL